MIELERTFLAKYIPEEIKTCPCKEIMDVYLPGSSPHPKLRLRKRGEVFEITKKEPVEGKDSSRQEEQTISLSQEEFEALAKLEGKKFRKLRYYWNSPFGHAEVDVFQDNLKGLVLVDFEFENVGKKDAFQMPDFCLLDVTQELCLAGGMLAGKKYLDIERDLEKMGYSPIEF
jgi:CYTH domain-containing protein